MFNPDWENAFFFTWYDCAPHCMLCFRHLSVAKKSNLQRHYLSIHKEYEIYTGHEREILVKNVKTIFMESMKESHEEPLSSSDERATQQSQIVSKKRKSSFVIALSLAKQCRPLTDGVFFMELLSTVLDCFGEQGRDLKELLDSSSLSHETLKLRIDVISAYIQLQIKKTVIGSIAFSILLDEWMDIHSNSQLMICVRTVDELFNVNEAFFALEAIEGEATGENIYKRLEKSLFPYAHMEKLASICTNDAPVMTDQTTGLVAYLLENNINVPVFHCKIQEQILFSKTLKTADTVKIVTNAIKELREQTQTQGKLNEFLSEIYNEYEDVLLYTEARWLNCKNSFEKLLNLRTEIEQCVAQENTTESKLLVKSMKDPDFLIILAFLTDITKYLGMLNDSLHGNNKFIFDLVRAIDEFGRKLSILHNQLISGNLINFTNMQSICEEYQDDIDLNQFNEIFVALIEDYNARFVDIDKIRSSIEVFENSLSCCLELHDELIQDDLINMRSDLSLPLTNGIEFWRNVSSTLYPNVLKAVYKLCSMFATTTICESSFTALKLIQSKHRAQLSQKTLRDLVLINCFKEEIDIDDVINSPISLASMSLPLQ